MFEKLTRFVFPGARSRILLGALAGGVLGGLQSDAPHHDEGVLAGAAVGAGVGLFGPRLLTRRLRAGGLATLVNPVTFAVAGAAAGTIFDREDRLRGMRLGAAAGLIGEVGFRWSLGHAVTARTGKQYFAERVLRKVVLPVAATAFTARAAYQYTTNLPQARAAAIRDNGDDYYQTLTSNRLEMGGGATRAALFAADATGDLVLALNAARRGGIPT